MKKKYPGPRELAAYLEGKRKAKHRFKDKAGGRCCLGHYGDMCGLEYPPDQDLFGYSEHGDYTAFEGHVVLPEGHWLYDLQEVLADANDNHVGFDEVIKILQEEADFQEKTQR